MLHVTKTQLLEVCILEWDIHKDNRGIKHQTFSLQALRAAGIPINFVEEIIYCPEKKGTLYGIHFQNHPQAQTKLIYCIQGKGVDVVVDLRKNSMTFKQWMMIELSSENRKQILVPKGFGHAFLTLEAHTQIVFRIDNYFDQNLSRSVSYKDPELGIPFPIEHPILSQQDQEAPLLKDCDCNL
jgi:dTDP-4-dehydrorhamnose 3,5-epimerase